MTLEEMERLRVDLAYCRIKAAIIQRFWFVYYLRIPTIPALLDILFGYHLYLCVDQWMDMDHLN